MVYLSGGLSHQDTFDLKPDAPKEIRGEFQPIATRVAGIQVGNLLPMTAAAMDKLVVVRSLVGLRDEHSSFQNITGYPMSTSQREGKPHFGSIISKVQGPLDPVVPPFVDLFPTMQHKPYNSPGAGHLGMAYGAAKLQGEDLALVRQTEVTADRFAERRSLLLRFDQCRREIESADVEGMDSFYQKAFEVLTSSKVAKAARTSIEKTSKLKDR